MSRITLNDFLYEVHIDTVYDPVVFTYSNIREALAMLVEITTQGYDASLKLYHNEE